MTLKSIWVDYCENGSIHGLRHVIQEDETPWRRYYLVTNTDMTDLIFN